jgi:hypothetical protein
MREKVNVAPSVVRTIFSTYAIPEEYDPAVKLQVRLQASFGATEVDVAGETQLKVGAVVSFIPLRK